MSHRDDATDALSYLFQAIGDRTVIAYWYHDGQVNQHEFTSLNNMMAFNSPIPINSQLCVATPMQTRWYQVNARNRLVPVPIDVCRELRAALLLLGISP